MRKPTVVLGIWPCTAVLLLLHQPQLTKPQFNGFEETGAIDDDFKEGKRSGSGVYSNPVKGEEYAGSWADNMRCGHGVQDYSKQVSYAGQIWAGKAEGLAKCTMQTALCTRDNGELKNERAMAE